MLRFRTDQGGVLKRRQVLLCMTLCLFTARSEPALAKFPVFPVIKLQQPQDPASASQQTSPPAQDPPASKVSADPGAAGGKNGTPPDSPQPKVQPDNTPHQTKRILWVIPNFKSVSANTYLPPQSFKQKFWLATQDSFDYSGFVWAGMVAGISMGEGSESSFGQGASGYGIYYAHTLADNTIENYLVEAFVPTVTKEDPRYYTLGHGGFFKRTAYSVSRLFITRTDSGRPMVNISEIAGAGGGAGISHFYYPKTSNVWVKTYQLWGSQLIQDGLGNIAKEFWPEVNRSLFHNKY